MELTPLPLSAHVLRSSLDRGLVRRFERGEVVRLQPGYYVEAERWAAWPDRERFHAVATAKHLHRGATLCGEAALLVMGLPTFGLPPALTLAVRSPSLAGRRPDVVRFTPSPHSAALAAVRPVLVRGHAHPETATATAGDFSIRDPAHCVLEVITRAPLTRSLAITDALARGPMVQGLAPADVLALAEVEATGIRLARARIALNNARGAAESPGESASRAIMIEAGLAPPELQYELWDDRGTIGYADFCWPGARVIGEFDGRVKYSGTLGQSAQEAIWAEKQRENRMMRAGFRVIRWTWADLFQPERLVATLRAAGVPLRA